MIGRKISDQTITCKVIKPMQITVNNNISVTVQKGDSPNKQTTKVPSINYEPIQQNMGRVFGTSNNEMQVQVDIGLNYQNEFNRLNHYGKEDREKNMVKNFRQGGRIDKELINKTDKQTKQVSSRNVTHFFINNKDKPQNVEPVKKTNQFQKPVTVIPQNEVKKSIQTPKTQDVSFKTTKDNKTIQIEDKATINNKSRLIDANNKRVTQNTTKVSSTHKQKTPSNNQAKLNNQRLTIYHSKEASNTQSHKEIPKMIKPLTNQQSKQRLSVIQNSSKLISSTSIHKHGKSAKKNDRSAQKDQRQKSVKTKDNKSLDKNQRVKSRQSELSKKQFDVSFQPWGQISEEPSVCIQNYSPNKSNELINNHDDQQQELKQQLTKMNFNHLKKPQFKAQQQPKQQLQSQQQNERQSFNNNINKKQQVVQVPKVNVSKVPFKKYMSVKEEIQEKLKEKKLKQQQLQLKRKQVQHQKRLEEEGKVKEETQQVDMDNNENEEYQQLEQEQYEQERRVIPQPISVPFVAPLKNHTNQEDALPQVKEDNLISTDNNIDITQINMDNSQLIYNEIMNLQQEQLTTNNQQNNQNRPLYNYVQSSDQQHEGQYQMQKDNKNEQEQGELKEIKGSSQMVLFEFNQQNQQNITDLEKFRKFQQDLQQELNNKVKTNLQYSKHEQNAQLFEDQQIDFSAYQTQNQKPIVVQNNLTRNPQILSTNNTIIHKSSALNSNKLSTSTNTLTSKPIVKKPQHQQQKQQQQSDQQQQQQTNPKLLQYLKNRNLISSNKSINPTKPNTSNSTTKSIISHSKQSRVRISQLLNHNTYYQTSRQVIVEVDEEYLQSSIIANQSIHSQNNQKDVVYHNHQHITISRNHEYSSSRQQLDGMNVELYRPKMYEMNQYDLHNKQIQICDSSSDSQDVKRNNLTLKNPPFINSSASGNPSSIDELFDLNLQSLLNKQFININ